MRVLLVEDDRKAANSEVNALVQERRAVQLDCVPARTYVHLVDVASAIRARPCARFLVNKCPNEGLAEFPPVSVEVTANALHHTGGELHHFAVS
jgi:hypothetical protein